METTLQERRRRELEAKRKAWDDRRREMHEKVDAIANAMQRSVAEIRELTAERDFLSGELSIALTAGEALMQERDELKAELLRTRQGFNAVCAQRDEAWGRT